MTAQVQQLPTAVLPPRFKRPSIFAGASYLSLVAVIIYSFSGSGISVSAFIDGIGHMGQLISEMFPPATSRVGSLAWSVVETFQMAIAGTVLGIAVSFPLAILACRATAPHTVVYQLARLLISFFRTVPDLVWALFFVATVGLGAFAGTLTLMVDSIGFCGRFFAESLEEIDPAPQEALRAIGAGRIGTFFSAMVPAALPSFVNTGLYSLEKAVRSSVILGLVGAGGIGIELKVAMDMFRYDEAATIILIILVLVLLVERVSSRVRARIIN